MTKYHTVKIPPRLRYVKGAISRWISVLAVSWARGGTTYGGKNELISTF
ncbi:MAG: hypothetical protein MPJ50_17580 [Pirellulales bacterium]|nr:hypothetical protein [Pirellulales bacterium]